MSKTVKNITEKPLSIEGFGVVAAGDTVTVPDDFNNPNFEVVKAGKSEEATAPKTDDKETEVAPHAPRKKGDKK